MLESEKESNVSESDVLDGAGGGGYERWRAIFSAGLVEGFPPLRFLPMVGCCGYVRARPHDNGYGGTTLPRRLTCGCWCPVGEAVKTAV